MRERNKRKRLKSVVCLFFVLTTSVAFSQNKWKLAYESSHIYDSSVFYVRQWQNEAIENQKSEESFLAALELISLHGYNGFYFKAEQIVDSLEEIRNLSVKQEIDLFAQIGLLKRNMDDFKASLFSYSQAIEISTKNGLWEDVTQNIINKAELFRATQRYDQAWKQLEMAEDLYEEKQLNISFVQYRVFERKAAVLNETGKRKQAEVYCRKAIEIAIASGLTKKLTVAYNELGSIFVQYKQKDSAEYYLRLAVKVAKENGLVREELQAYVGLGYFYGQYNSQRQEAIEILEYVLKRKEETQIPFLLNDVYYWLSVHYERNGNCNQAMEYRNQSFQTLLEIERKRYDVSFLNATEKYNSALLKKELSVVESELDGTQSKLESESKKFRVALINAIVLGIALLIIVILLIILNRKRNQLNRELEKKQALIQEVHHRTKNNIQFINSLINLQMNTDLSSEETIPLQDVSRRIQAMGLVHEMLYKDDDTDYLEMSDYIQQLVSYQKNVVLSDEKKVEFILEVDSITLDIASATAVGIIVSECINNSIEHAFMAESNPQITISLKKMNSLCTISYSDNGSGLSEDVDMLQPSTLGLRLVDIFVRQLKGHYSIESEKGFALTVNFKLKV